MNKLQNILKMVGKSLYPRLAYLSISIVFVFASSFVGVHAQTEDSLKKELAYWYKHLPEWKKYKVQIAHQKKAYEMYLDSIKNYKEFRVALQKLYDDIADRTDLADSLIILYEAQKQAILKQQKRNRNGLIFRIQIQSAQRHELDNYAIPNTMIKIEHSSKNIKKYLLGDFQVYEEAQALVDILRNGGASVYIVAYKDGERLKDFSQYLD